MYRYSPHTRRNEAGSSQLRKNVQTALTLILVVAVIVLGYFCWNGGSYQQSAHDLFIQKIQVECNDALSLCNTLSRTAGSSTSSTLGKIRQHIYSADTISNLNDGLEGRDGTLVEETYFSNIYSQLDVYEQKIITGTSTGDNQTQLSDSVSLLCELVNALK